jgi:hypothetical protein
MGNNPASEEFQKTISMLDSGRTVTFFHEGASPGTLHTYTVHMTTLGEDETLYYNVADASATTSGTGSCAETGSIDREVWNNIAGTDVSAIPVNTTPSSVTTLTLFEAPSNQGSNYGARIRGFICPPATGLYSFWIASDDKSELWLGTSEDPVTKRKIASVNAHTDIRQWDKYTSQKSATYYLTQGQRYYIEALHKEATGGDNLAVGWQLPDGSMERPIAGNRLMRFVKPPIPGSCEGIGSIKWEVWQNEPGTTINYATLNTTPDVTSSLNKFESQQYYGTSYLSRTSGFVCVPLSGHYTFWIASDDQSDLWLSTNAYPEYKVKIASVPGYTPYGNWEKYATQKSAPIFLQAGDRYYIEAVHKEGTGGDFVAVGWQLPDGTMERPIPGNRLLPYTNPPIDPPGVEIIEPTSDMKFDEPANIYIHAFPYDSDTTARITKVEFYNGATKLGEDSTYRHEFAWWNVPQGTYTIIAKVYNDKGATNTSQVTITVAAPSCAEDEGAGYLDREIWRNIAGTSVSDIPVNQEPDDVSLVNTFETGTYFANNYGERILGFVCVPVTGEYTFWISGDDNSELWLSTDYLSHHKVKIASVPGATNVRQWTKYASQQSAPVTLKAGYKYYIEALHKEGNGNDHVAVGWQLPDGTLERPIPGNRLIGYYVYSDYPLPHGVAISEEEMKSGVEEKENNSRNVISLSPNPVINREVTLGVDGDKLSNLQGAEVKVISMTGEIVHAETVQCDGGDCSNALMTFKSDVQPGIYMVNVVAKGKRWSKKLIVK